MFQDIPDGNGNEMSEHGIGCWNMISDVSTANALPNAINSFA
jgi:hypothetical protein